MQATPRLRQRQLAGDDFFLLDRGLGRILHRNRLLLEPALGGLLLRTAILGECEHRQRKVKSAPGRVALNSADILALHHSRFFAVSDWIEPPAGPRPMPRTEFSPAHVRDLGLHVAPRREPRLAEAVLGHMQEQWAGVFDLPLFRRADLLAFKPEGLRPVCAVTLFFRDLGPGAVQALGADLAAFQKRSELPLEYFMRSNEAGHFSPALTGGPDHHLAPRPMKKVVFRQSNLSRLSGVLVLIRTRKP